MGGFTNEEPDELNLGQNFKYPDISGIETDIMPQVNTDDLDPTVKFSVGIIILFALLISIFAYLRNAGMSMGEFFKSLRDKIKWAQEQEFRHLLLLYQNKSDNLNYDKRYCHTFNISTFNNEILHCNVYIFKI